MLQPKADHQGSTIRFTELRWIGPYITEKVLPNNKYLVRKVGTNETQLLYCMRMPQFTPRQPIHVIQITPQEWTPYQEVNLKYDDLFARAWECEYEKSFFDAESDKATPPNSPKIPVQSDLSTKETWNTPGSAQECSRESYPQTEEL